MKTVAEAEAEAEEEGVRELIDDTGSSSTALRVNDCHKLTLSIPILLSISSKSSKVPPRTTYDNTTDEGCE